MMHKDAAPDRFDAVIAGGGLVGMTQAIALAGAGLTVAVIDTVPLADQTLPAFDGRVSALALGSQRMLAQLGIWRYMQAEAEPIRDIRVSDNDSLLFLHYDHRQVGSEPFGYIVENRRNRLALQRRAAELSGLALFSPVEITAVERDAHQACLTLKDGRVLRAAVVIGADGKHSRMRERAGIRVTEAKYGQTAIVCTVAHEEPHRGLAQERFLPQGPFAVLPMQGNRSSLVWVEPDALAQAYLRLPDEELNREIARRVGGYLGKIAVDGPRFAYPLSLMLAERYADTRLALIGDAAHAIHPIAGQGVNLGYRDVAALAEAMVDAKRLGLDIGGAGVLSHYQQWRRFDTLSMAFVTDLLTRLFSNDIAPLALARRLGLAAVQKMPPVKRYFMRHAMGLTGDLPRLIKGEAL